MFLQLAFFVLILPASIVAYAIVPRRFRWMVLLAFSLMCFYHQSKGLIGFFFATTLSCYVCGLGMSAIMAKRDEEVKKTKKGRRAIKAAYKGRMKWVLAAGILVNLGMLFACKYLSYFVSLVHPLPANATPEQIEAANAAIPHIGMPIGISFYTLMAISYLVDVYRETIPADKNPAKLALFLSFFPQILEGPICRYGQTAHDLFKGEQVNRDNLYQGTLRILYGLAKKLIVADRLNDFVGIIFDGYASYDGGMIALAAILYTIQLYCDFSGALDVAIGIGRIFDVKLPENFRQPFFSRTASEFWQRWHITLGTWFKDYVYYPVSLSGPCKSLTTAARKRFGLRYGPLLASSVALFCVWTCNGFWHGAGSQYLFFGLYYFVLITLGGLVEPLAQDLSERYGINRDAIPYRLMQSARTLAVVFVGEMFFRANGLRAGLEMFNIMLHNFTLASINMDFLPEVKLGPGNVRSVIVTMIVVFVVGLLKERGHDVSSCIASRGPIVRWGVLVALFLAIVVFGAYGVGYVPVDPMYAEF